jgi:glycine oxidase
MAKHDITVLGAGIFGLWQALVLARAGHLVHLTDVSPNPFAENASQHAGAMLAPDCESESAPPIVRDLGRRGLELWRANYPHLINAGSLVVASPRDRPELLRFQKLTSNHAFLGGSEIAELEPDLGGRYAEALFFAGEAHMVTPDALAFLLAEIKDAGADVSLGAPPVSRQRQRIVVDCRGLASRSELPSLRGVRGERLLVRARDVSLHRPVRLLHPRHPLYVVPWSGGRYLVGATMIESEDASPVTVRSALELLGTAYALHPAFGEAEILAMSAGVRPAFPDNIPRAIVRNNGQHIYVNGAYRHGYLLAPVLAEAVAGYLDGAVSHTLLTKEEG